LSECHPWRSSCSPTRRLADSQPSVSNPSFLVSFFLSPAFDHILDNLLAAYIAFCINQRSSIYTSLYLPAHRSNRTTPPTSISVANILSLLAPPPSTPRWRRRVRQLAYSAVSSNKCRGTRTFQASAAAWWGAISLNGKSC
jgi:hypothetical protein